MYHMNRTAHATKEHEHKTPTQLANEPAQETNRTATTQTAKTMMKR